MTIEQFDRAVKVASLLETDRKWFPKWIRGYALFHKIAPSDSLTLDENRVIGYLQHLRDKGTQAWQRKQAAKALQTYQNILVRQELVHFQPILKKLDELAGREKRAKGNPSGDHQAVAGEGNAGKVNADALSFFSFS